MICQLMGACRLNPGKLCHILLQKPSNVSFRMVSTSPHTPDNGYKNLDNDRADCRIIIFRWILILFQEVLHHLPHTGTSGFFFLQVYYARITEFLRSQPSPLQRSIDTG